MPSTKKRKTKAETGTEAAGTKKVRKQKNASPEVRAGRGESDRSQLSLAAAVLRKAGKALACREILEGVTKAGWTSNGKTPAATLYSSIIREISKKGAQSRFRKTERGHFEYAGA